MAYITHKRQIRLINEAIYDTRLTMVERKFYKWISTQNKHKHVFFFSKRWNENWLRINQKYKKR